MRRESSTVVSIVGEVDDAVLTEVSRSPNIAVARPPSEEADPLAAAVAALRQASRKSAPFVLVPADPLAMVAAGWQAMWNLSEGPRGAAAFEERSAQALAAWRARQFELPDYYLVLTRADTGGPGLAASPPAAVAGPPPAGQGRPGDGRPGTEPDAQEAGSQPAEALAGLHLGPLRTARPRRVSAVVISDGAELADIREQTARVLHALRSLAHGPWWPPLDELIDSVRRHYPGSIAGSGVPLAG